ncbi:MAG TPA: hypothetical protein VJU78_06655 [Chitinophagaceae bacterium]|nr:hypothetical protein [Chitinophagaceae bacterium]
MTTPFQHYTVIADGVVGQLEQEFECRPGKAYMGMKTWATDTDESADMARIISVLPGSSQSPNKQTVPTGFAVKSLEHGSNPAYRNLRTFKYGNKMET